MSDKKELVCRLCMSKTYLLLSVFEFEKLKDIILDCTNIMILDCDKMSTHICSYCAIKVKEYYRFKQQCLLTQQKFADELIAQALTDIKRREVLIAKTPLTPIEIETVNHQALDDLRNIELYPIDMDEDMLPTPSLIYDYEPREKRMRKAKFENIKSFDVDPFDKVEILDSTIDDGSDDISDDPTEERMGEAKPENTKSSDVNQLDKVEILNSTIDDCSDDISDEVSDDITDEEHPEDGSPSKWSKRRQRFMEKKYSKTGKRKYVYDLKKIYQNQLNACETCGKMIAKTRMEGHQNKHLGIRPFNCEKEGCEATFHCTQLRLHHYRNSHSEEQQKCDICSKVFRSKRSLGYHQRDVHTERSIKCSICGGGFVSNSRLKQHVKYHTGERNHPCSVCKHSFYSNHDLQNHAKKHIKEQLKKLKKGVPQP